MKELSANSVQLLARQKSADKEEEYILHPVG